MTHEEVKRIINSDLVNYDELTEARKIAIECIDKQIPKKVIFDKNEQIWKNKCPNCNAGYLELEYLTEKYKFCITCGQALDWSDTE